MKVKIIAPSSDEVSLSILSEAKLMPNVALTYLAALAPEGIDFKLVDMALGDPVETMMNPATWLALPCTRQWLMPLSA